MKKEQPNMRFFAGARSGITALVVGIMWSVQANSQVSDSLQTEPVLSEIPKEEVRIEFRPRQVIAPVSLAAAGLVTQGRISRHLQRKVVSEFPGFRTRVDDYLIFAPAAVTFGLSASGVRGKHRLREQLLLTVLSAVVAGGVTQVLKMSTRYPRPDKDGYGAFPSGHTSISFANAGVLHEEYGSQSVWYSIGGYANATAVGTLRVLNNRHWLADVLFGAGVGIGASKLVYLTYPWVKDKFRKKKKR